MGKKLSSECQNNIFRSSVLKLYDIQEKFKQVERDYEEERKQLQSKIRSYLTGNNLSTANFVADSGQYKDNNKKFKVTDVVRKKIEFDVDALEKKLPKATLRDIIVRTYRISDYRGLVKYLKQCNVDPHKFKQFIEVEKTVDTKTLDRLSDIGEVDLKDIEGCHTVTDGTPYIKLTVDDYVEPESETAEGV